MMLYIREQLPSFPKATQTHLYTFPQVYSQAHTHTHTLAHNFSEEAE